MHPFHQDTQECFPNFDYHHPNDGVCVDFSRPENKVGYQQRAFNVYWALKQCNSMDLGIEIGCRRQFTPYCIHIDLFYNNIGAHPFYGEFGTADIIYDASKLTIFPSNTFSFVSANHSIEHMPVPGDDGIIDMLRNEWIRVLRKDGILALIIPDNAHFDVMASDKDHKHAWSHADFENRILNKLYDLVELIEYDTLKNNHSFNVVLKKK